FNTTMRVRGVRTRQHHPKISHMFVCTPSFGQLSRRCVRSSLQSERSNKRCNLCRKSRRLWSQSSDMLQLSQLTPQSPNNLFDMLPTIELGNTESRYYLISTPLHLTVQTLTHLSCTDMM